MQTYSIAKRLLPGINAQVFRNICKYDFRLLRKQIEYSDGKADGILIEYFRIHQVNRVQKHQKLGVFGLILRRIFAFWCILL